MLIIYVFESSLSLYDTSVLDSYVIRLYLVLVYLSKWWLKTVSYFSRLFRGDVTIANVFGFILVFIFWNLCVCIFAGTSCGNLTDPLNGVVMNGIDRVFEDWANYSCDPGWEFLGGLSFIETQCNATGLWSVPPPICQSKPYVCIIPITQCFLGAVYLLLNCRQSHAISLQTF